MATIVLCTCTKRLVTDSREAQYEGAGWQPRDIIDEEGTWHGLYRAPAEGRPQEILRIELRAASAAREARLADKAKRLAAETAVGEARKAVVRKLSAMSEKQIDQLLTLAGPA